MDTVVQATCTFCDLCLCICSEETAIRQCTKDVSSAVLMTFNAEILFVFSNGFLWHL